MDQLVLVTISGPDPKLVKTKLTPNSSSKDGQTLFTSTGFTFAALPEYVISSLLPIHPFLQPQFRSRPSTVPPALHGARASIASNSKLILLPGSRITCSFPKQSPSSIDTTTVQEAYIERIVELKEVRTALRSLLTAPSATRWSLGWGGYSNSNSRNSTGELPLETQLDLGSHVVVLKMRPETDNSENNKELIRSATTTIENFTNLHLGAPVIAHGCPFGALVSLKFHNFMVSGAISAVLDHSSPSKKEIKQQQLLPLPLPLPPAPAAAVALSDLKLLPGMEGGVVYTRNDSPSNQKGHLIGILGPPLRAAESHAELTMIISAATVRDAVVQNLNNQISNSGYTSERFSTTYNTNTDRTEGVLAPFSEALKAVVAVEAKDGWASGVLISTQGHILTNAHALPVNASFSTHSPSINVLIAKNWVAAEVVHVFSAPIDLAVIKIKNKSPQIPRPVVLGKSHMCKPGSSVAVAGYPLWRPSSINTGTSSGTNQGSSRPMVTVGTAAFVVPASPAAPAVVLTTADVHAGASGGAVLDLETGCLLGLVTSNTRLSNRRPLPNRMNNNINSIKAPALLFPHLNYCLGSSALAPVIDAITTAAAGKTGHLVDWSTVERTLEESGVVKAWHSMRSMANLNVSDQIKRNSNLPPALDALMKSKIESSGGNAARPKL